METVLIDLKQFEHDHRNECNYIRLLMLLSKNITLFTALAYSYSNVYQSNNGNTKAFLFLYRTNNLKDVFHVTDEELEQDYKDLCYLKSKKFRTPNEIKRWNLLQRMFEIIRDYLKENYKILLEDFGLLQLKPWIDTKEIFNQTLLCDDIPQHQDFLTLKLPEMLMDKQVYLTLIGFQGDGKKNSVLKPGFSDKLWLNAPGLRCLTFEELEFTRERLLKSFEPVDELLLSFRSMIQEEQFIGKNVKKMQKQMDEFTAKTGSLLAKEIDSQLFIKKANSVQGDGSSLKLSLAVTNRENLLELFIRSNILLPATANELKQIFIREGNLHNGCLVMLAG